jgi:hypothetical protein
MADPGKLRVSDQEREGAIEELREHTVVGRLTAEELDERLDAVYRAKTRADLDALRADLPVSSAAARRALTARRSHLRRRLLQESGGALAASLVCVAIWIAAGASGSFWPIWVIIFTLLPVVRDGWALLGPGSNLQALESTLQARHERRLAREARRARWRLPR